MIRIRKMQQKDIKFAYQISKREGWVEKWGTSIENFRKSILHDPNGCFVAEENDKTKGFVTTSSEREFGFIANLIVLQRERRKGIGTALMRQAISYLERKGIDTIKLDAVPEAVSLYRKLGFREDYETFRYQGVWQRAIEDSNIRKMDRRDLDDVFQLNRRYLGTYCENISKSLFSRSHALCFTGKFENNIESYIAGEKCSQFYYVRSWVCNPKFKYLAKNLIKVFCRNVKENLVKINVPAPNKRAIEIVRQMGFRKFPDCTRIRMSFGKRSIIENVEGIFGM